MFGGGKLNVDKIKVELSKGKLVFSAFLKNKDQYEKASGKIHLKTWKSIEGLSVLDDWEIAKSKDGYRLSLITEGSPETGVVVEAFKKMVS